VSPVLVKNEETGVSLIKIYLIKKVQLEYLVRVQSQTEFKGKGIRCLIVLI
jgi:hypothetical protein